MSAASHRGWLVAALVLAVSLLVGSVAVVATQTSRWSPADRPGWGTSQDRVPDRDGTGLWDRTGMMGGAGWADDRAARRDDCLDLMRERQGR